MFASVFISWLIFHYQPSSAAMGIGGSLSLGVFFVVVVINESWMQKVTIMLTLTHSFP